MLVVPRGEAVRNFIYSDTLPHLSQSARVVVLSVVVNEEVLREAQPYAEQIIPIREHPARPFVAYFRSILETAHDRWLWSRVAQNNWELRTRRARQQGAVQNVQWRFMAVLARLLANNTSLHALTSIEQTLQWKYRSTSEYDDLFARLKPALVFNGSHIHGFAGELPVRVAHRMGIPTAGFIFSWDNLTSRSRILAPYDQWLVWNETMRDQLLRIYPRIPSPTVHVTGTPQFDFHFKDRFLLRREALCERIGVDPRRPFILYTTGIWNHFYEEHRHVELVMRTLRDLPLAARPQLVVRNYAKGTATALREMARRQYPDVVFPPVLWDERWLLPQYQDLFIYTSLVHHAALSINAASTVTLEFLLKDKPVINLDFDPPGTSLPWCMGYERHIRFDHFWPVAQSGATMVARSEEDMRRFLLRGLTEPERDSPTRRSFITGMFAGLLDGRSGERIAHRLARLASEPREAQPQRTFQPRVG